MAKQNKTPDFPVGSLIRSPLGWLYVIRSCQQIDLYNVIVSGNPTADRDSLLLSPEEGDKIGLFRAGALILPKI
jgi:hypothetical protein